MRKSLFQVFFKEQLKHFPTTGAKDLRVDFNCHKAHIKNTLIKIAPRPWSSNWKSYVKIAIFLYFFQYYFSGPPAAWER